MAKRPSPIIQRLSIEGGDEVVAELKRMGLAGEVAGRQLEKALNDANKTGLDPLVASLKRAQTQMQTLSKSFALVGRQFTSVGRTMSLAISAPIVAGFGFAIKAATDFESKMADIARVAEVPSPEGLTQLGESLRAMAVDIGVAVGDLQDIAQAAAAAGIPFNELAGFTELVAKGAVALNLGFGETGEALAKIKTSLDLTIPQIGQLIDAVALLADEGAAADAEIIGVVQEIGALAKQAGLSELEVAALGSTMISMGVDAESAGTAIRNMLLNMASGREATAGFARALQELGLDAVDVAKRMQTDGIGTILDLLDRVSKKAPEVRLQLLQGLFDRRGAQAIAPLLGNLGELERQLGLVADRTLFAGRAQEEFARRSETSQQKIRLFYTALEDLGIVVGQEVLPTFTDLTETVTDLLKAFADSGPMVQWGVRLAAVAAATGPFIFAIGQTLNAIGLLLKGGALLAAQFAAIRTAFLLGGLAAAAVAAPFTALVAALALATGGIALLATSQSRAGAAARAHADAVAHLDGLIAQSKAGVEGATEAARKYADEQIRAAQAVVETMHAEIERFNIINEFGQEQEQVIPGPDITTIRDATERVADFKQRLAELAASGTETGRAIAAGAREAGTAIDAAGEKAKRAFPGPAANIRSVSDSPFAKVKEDAKEAGDEAERSGGKVETATDGMASHIRTVPEEWRKAGQAASEMADEATRSIGKIEPALDAVGTAIQKTKGDLLTIGEGATESLELIGPAFEELGRQAGEAFTGAGESVTLFGSVANDTLQGIEEQATATATALPGLFQTAAQSMAQAFAAAFAQVRSELSALQSAVSAALNAMAASLAALRREIAATRAAAASAATAAAGAGGGGGGSGFWQGGQVFGPGTATSDSIPAWLSAGEFVVRARAVEHYGPQIFAALNSLRVPRFDAPRFNTGGVVERINHSVSALRFNTGGPVPAMAGGGQVRDMGRLRIAIGSNGDFDVEGPVDVLGTFARALNHQRLTTTGRGPARIRK